MNHTEPVLGTEAIAAGEFTRRTIGRRNRQLSRNVYLPPGVELTPRTRAVAAWLWSERRATVAGLSASALHGGRWIHPDAPAELTRIAGSANDIYIHRERLSDDEVSPVGDLIVTTPARTAFDLGRRKGLTEAVIRLDALADATGLDTAAVSSVATAHPGARGIVQLRQAVDLMDGGAESPQETRTRLPLINAGMRPPTTQLAVHDDFGHAFARIDMGWPAFKVGVEYDGPQHWTDPERRSRDIDRYAELTAKDWLIIRVSAELLRCRPWVVVDRVRDALRAKDCPWVDECRVVHRDWRRGVA